jgi:hypothetical protein
VKNAEEALQLYVETATKHGDPLPPETDTHQRAGFVVERQKGSHVIPMHPGEFPRPLLQTILKQAGLSVEDFRKLL